MQRVVRHRAKILRVYFSLGNVVMITNILVVSILAQSDLHNTQLLIYIQFRQNNLFSRNWPSFLRATDKRSLTYVLNVSH